MHVLRWLWDFWYVPVFALVAIGGLVLVLALRAAGGGDGWDPLEWLRQEMRVIQAGREAREVKINADEAIAVARVNEKYAARRAALDGAAAARIKELEDDPVALARALERASRG